MAWGERSGKLRDGRFWLLLGYTTIFLAYFLVWLPGPGVALQILGFELGEWIKFTGVGMARNYFYLPPITLGLMLALWTALWPQRWQTWTARLLAIGASLLALPAVEAVLYEPRSEWLLRLLLIGLVGATALAAHWLGRWPRAVWLILLLLALTGAALPTWQYQAIRPLVAYWLQKPIGVGPGVWLNAAGHLLLAAAAFHHLRLTAKKTMF